MNFTWNYFDEPRVIGFGIENVAIAAKITTYGSMLYWIKDPIEGLRLIEITAKDES